MPTLDQLLLLLPALILIGGAVLLVLSEAFLATDADSEADRRYQPFLAIGIALLSLIASFREVSAPPRAFFGGIARVDGFQGFLALVIGVGLVLSIGLSSSFLRRFNSVRGEYYGLMLLAASGMLLLVQATDLILLFVALELMSVAIYAMAAWMRRSQKSTESALKYFLLGAFASALFLYGVALLYGATGTTRLDAIAPHLFDQTLLMKMAIALILAGLAFKVAAVPFHMWAPDVYEGAPTPVTAFMAVGVKAAAFGALFRILAVALGTFVSDWGSILTVLAIATMLGGNVLALPQRSVKRMLAYSSIAHAGYILVGLISAGTFEARTDGGLGVLFYLFSYAVSAVGAFGVVAAVERREKDGMSAWDLDRFAGLSKRRPLLAALMALFMLSLAGVPPTVGFMGKLLIFKSAVTAGEWGLAITGIVTSAVGAYYYLRVIVYLYFREPAAEAKEIERMPGLEWTLLAAAALVVVLGIGPASLISLAKAGAVAVFQ